MKRTIGLIMLLSILLLLGCEKQTKYSVEQQKAINNSINYIKGNSYFANMINVDFIEIKNVQEGIENIAIIYNEDLIDTTDWIVTVGNIAENEKFEQVICDSETYEIIGSIPFN